MTERTITELDQYLRANNENYSAANPEDLRPSLQETEDLFEKADAMPGIEQFDFLGENGDDFQDPNAGRMLAVHSGGIHNKFSAASPGNHPM